MSHEKVTEAEKMIEDGLLARFDVGEVLHKALGKGERDLPDSIALQMFVGLHESPSESSSDRSDD
jgi:hypothetical protein